MPGVISERLFFVLDQDDDGYLSKKEFAGGLSSIFSESYDKLIEFIFKLYDFDKDGKICREDIMVVFSYITLKVLDYSLTSIKQFKYEKSEDEYKNRVESQIEINKYLDIIFEEETLIDMGHFKTKIEGRSSEAFLFVFFLIKLSYLFF